MTGGAHGAWCYMALPSLWRRAVCNVAASCGFALPRWEVRLRESVPLGEGKHAGVSVACCWGAG